jgi:F420-dependent oxidoreductase-like protein
MKSFHRKKSLIWEMKFGYQQPSHTFEGKRTIFETLVDIVKRCEDQGYDSFWIMDHLLQIDLAGSLEEPIMESYTTLSALAAVTHKIKLGALCTCNFFRNPALLAKMGATIDQISNGRFWLGLGAGWFEDEAKRYGYKFENNKLRLQMLEESLQIINKAWTEENPSFQGRYYSIENFVLTPKPIQKPRPKILVGGGGERVTLKLVAKYADACNLFSGGEELQRKLDVLKNYCSEFGRDYSELFKTKLATVMFVKSKEEGTKKIEEFGRAWMSMESYLDTFLLGNPSEISNRVSKLAEIGIDYLTINFRGKYDPNDQQTFAREVMTRF